MLRSLGAAALAASALPRALRAFPASRALDGVGVQLYTLRNEMRADPEGTLREIARLGYQEIEWWGDWGRSPSVLRSQLDALSLKAPAWHVPVEALQPERIDATIATAQAMGHKHLIVAWTAPAQRSAEGFGRLGALLSAAGRQASAHGIRTGYHNHDFEFERIGEQTRWDLLLATSDPAYVDIELDCFWAFKAGHDPVQLLQRHRDRITHLHLKDSAGPPDHRQMDVGHGVIDWRRLLSVALEGRVRNVFVEHDEPADAWATVAAGREYLRRLGY
ncbi:MAG: sugar phosphate isomerase/epimerase [Gemmatimonadaceae bacterium]|nr:sugar phosphate isomerase/epimerase [Gemmatimonadaceae bacterium]MCW5826609.1 sugar phosphate isomerase/epimerase [Gemmatimonadaceae bacterium]